MAADRLMLGSRLARRRYPRRAVVPSVAVGEDPCAEERHVELVTGRTLIVLAVIVIALLAVFWLLAMTRHPEP